MLVGRRERGGGGSVGVPIALSSTCVIILEERFTLFVIKHRLAIRLDSLVTEIELHV